MVLCTKVLADSLRCYNFFLLGFRFLIMSLVGERALLSSRHFIGGPKISARKSYSGIDVVELRCKEKSEKHLARM